METVPNCAHTTHRRTQSPRGHVTLPHARTLGRQPENCPAPLLSARSAARPLNLRLFHITATPPSAPRAADAALF